LETKQIPIRPITRIWLLLIVGTLLSGLLAGATIDRLVVGLPAWRYVGIIAWAEYSRHADLGNGIFIFPVEAIGSFSVLIASAIILLKNQNKSVEKSISLPVHLASIFALLGLILTFFAGPFMLSIRNMNDPALLQHAFDQFYYWSTFRGIAQVLSFFACVWAMFGINKLG
jgi:hypothetical protein